MIDTALLTEMLKDPANMQDRLHALIAEKTATDERFGAFAQLFQQASEPHGPASSNSSRRIALDQVRLRVTQMKDELEAQSQRSAMLASALGACGVCLGMTPDCRECHGQGNAGWRSPDPILFQQIISPAIRRLAQEIELHSPQEGPEQ